MKNRPILEHSVRVGSNSGYIMCAAERLSMENERAAGFMAIATGNEANSMDASVADRASLSTYPTSPLPSSPRLTAHHHPRSFAVINERLDAARRKQPRCCRLLLSYPLASSFSSISVCPPLDFQFIRVRN